MSLWRKYTLARGGYVPLLLAAVTAGFFWKILFLNRAIGGLDVLEYFYPYRVFAAKAIRAGHLPLWNPAIFGGVPFLANIQSAIFYPFSGLFYIMSEPAAYTWNIVLHAFLGALFGYLFARQSLDLSRGGALTAGLTFAFGGFLGGQAGHLNQFSAAIWLPALLLCWDKASSGRLLYVPVGAGVVAIQFLAGHTQESYLMLLTFGLYAVWRAAGAAKRQGPLVLASDALILVLFVGLGAGLAAAQLIPTAELTAWSIRANGLSYADATSFSLRPDMLLEALLPPFWNRAMIVQPGGTEFLGYISVPGAMLAIVGLCCGRRRDAGFFGLLAAVTLCLALGKYNPLYPLLFRALPLLNSFRVPARWLFVFSFCAAILAGIGLDALLSARVSRRLLRASAAIVVAVGLAAAVLSRSQSLPPGRTLLTWLVAGCISLALLGLAVWRRGPDGAPTSGASGLAAGLIVLIVADLWVSSQSLDYNHPTLPSLFQQSLPTLDFLHGQAANSRVLSVAQDTFVPAAEPAIRQSLSGSLDPADLIDYLAAYKLREIAEPNTSMAAGIATVDGYDGGLLPLARYVPFKDALTQQPSSPDDRIRFVIKWLPNRALLDLAGGRFLITDALSDKSIDGVRYDLSGFMQVNRQQPREEMSLSTPLTASSLGVVVATSGAPSSAPAANLVLHATDGVSQTVPLHSGGQTAAGQLPYSKQLPVYLERVGLDRTEAIESVNLEVNPAFDGNVYLNGLAFIDAATGAADSPLVGPGPEMPQVFNGDVKIFENTGALGPAFLVHEAQEASNAGQAAGMVAAPGFNPAARVVVEGSPQPPAGSSILGRAMSRLRRMIAPADTFTIPQSWLQPAAGGQASDRITVNRYQPGNVVVSTNSTSEAFLVLAQSYYPGWQVTVDGAPQRLLAADGLFQAVHLPAGVHTVEFRFESRSFTAGVAVSIACCAVLVLALALALWPSRSGRSARGGVRGA